MVAAEIGNRKYPFVLGWAVEQPNFVIEFSPTEFEHYTFDDLEERDFVLKGILDLLR